MDNELSAILVGKFTRKQMRKVWKKETSTTEGGGLSEPSHLPLPERTEKIEAGDMNTMGSKRRHPMEKAGTAEGRKAL